MFKLKNIRTPNLLAIQFNRHISNNTSFNSEYISVNKDKNYEPELYYYEYDGLQSQTKLSYLSPTFYKDKPHQHIGTFNSKIDAYDCLKLPSTNFHPNPKFQTLVKKVIEENLMADVSLKYKMFNLKQGWCHIDDFKELPILNRVNDPENIFATVYFDKGEPILKSLQFFETHRIFVDRLGVMKLDTLYHNALMDKLMLVDIE